MSRHRIAVLGCALACAAVPAGVARADAPRVALVELPANIRRAIATALAPWETEIAVVPGPAPGMTGDLAADARAIADRHGAVAVVWIDADPALPTVYVYDAVNRRLTRRPLPGGPPPVDEPAAAAIALTVKTQLRNTAADPGGEGGEPEPEPEPEVRPQQPPPPVRSRLAFEIAAGVRAARPRGLEVEPRLDLGVSLALAPRVAAAVRVQAGPGVKLDNPGMGGGAGRPELDGRYLDGTAIAELRFQGAAGTAGALSVALGAALHVTRLSGTLAPQDAAVSRVFFDPSLRAGLDWRRPLGPRVDLFVWGCGAYTLRRQRYLVVGNPVLSVPRVGAELGAGVAVFLR